jgi:transcriptional antiterminator NusG
MPESAPTSAGTATAEVPAGSAQAEAEQPLNPNMRLFTLRVASNKEDRVRQNLVRKTRIEGLEGKIGRILVPTEKKMQVKDGKRIVVDQKKYLGYVFIEIEPDEHGRIPQEVWFLVKETDGVGDFIQASGKPHPLGRDEALRVIGESEEKEEPTLKTDYEKGERIKVIVGAFEGFEGEVDEVLADKGQVRIITTIFGRPTPLEVQYEEIEKAT